MLRRLTSEDVPHLKEFLQNKLPSSLNIFSTLQIIDAFKIEINIFVAETDPTLFTFIYDNRFNASLPSIFIFWDIERLPDEEVEKYLRSVPDWDWNQSFMTASIDSAFQEKLRDIFENKLITKPIINCSIYRHMIFLLNKEKLQELRLPNGYKFGESKSHQIPFAVSHWKYEKHLKNRSVFYKFLELLPSSAVFKDEDEESEHPLSWVFLRTYGHLGMLNTLEEYRGLGLGAAVTANLCKKLASKLDYVILETEPDCQASRLAEKVGFENLGDTYWSVFDL